ncbi:ribbon-helix-helix domain-containing protein [Methanomassiliicoccaceae archaeon COG_1]|nr:ribbon-helix-helix domain-containing protein [Methanomassiliicoccaceae archaeon COG_1]
MHGGWATEEDRKFTVRLPSEDAALLEALVRLRRYGSVSDAVRDAVSRLVDSELGGEARAATLASALPVVDASLLTSDGRGLEAAISDAIARGLESDRRCATPSSWAAAAEAAAPSRR